MSKKDNFFHYKKQFIAGAVAELGISEIRADIQYFRFRAPVEDRELLWYINVKANVALGFRPNFCSLLDHT